MEIAINPIQVKFGDGRSTLSTPFADNRNALNSPETTVTTTDLKEDFQSEPVSSRRQLEDNYEKFLKTQQQQKERKNYVAVKEIFIEDSSKRGVNQRASIKKMGQDVSGKHDGKYFEIPHVLDGFFMVSSIWF